MNKSLYLLDFDRTIFNTTTFVSDLKALLARTHQVPGPQFDQTISKYLDADGRLYNLATQTAKLAGITARQLQQLIHTNLNQNPYLYPDAAIWLESHGPEDVIIITTGQEDFQSLKFSLVPTLEPFTKIITPINKGPQIGEWVKGSGLLFGIDLNPNTFNNIYLLDDSPTTFTGLPVTSLFHPFRLNRQGDRYSTNATPADIIQITSFKELPS